MVSEKECLRHAVQCEYRVRISRDPKSRANWGRMAERWIERARSLERQDPCAHSQGNRVPERMANPMREILPDVALALT
jgi:hypothetical protein